MQDYCLDVDPVAGSVEGLNPHGSVDRSALQFSNAYATPMNVRRPPFDSVTIGFHWATVLVVLALFASGWLHMRVHDSVSRAILLQIHRSLGLTIWVATALRLTWRLTKAKLPPFPLNMPEVQQWLAKASEYGLYALLLVQPATGLGETLFRGRQFAIFLWRVPQLIPENTALLAAFDLAHKFGAWALGVLILGHATAALIHHFVLRDDVLQCMAPAIATERHKREFLVGRVIRNQYL